MSLLKTGNNRVGELTIEERAVLWLHKHYPNIEAVDLQAASKPPTQYIFPDYVCVHIINSWNQVEGKIYTKKKDIDLKEITEQPKNKNKKPSYY